MASGNDARGWIMAATSGIACTAGASIIGVDIIIRQFPSQKNFKIQDSNPFLSAGLSVSFGVMICSSLYSMLPSARGYLRRGGMEPKPAELLLITCFLLGASGIAILSRILHRFIPHSVVDCAHDHGDEEEGDIKTIDELQSQELGSTPWGRRPHPTGDNGEELPGEHRSHLAYGTVPSNPESAAILRRPSFQHQISSKVSQLVSGHKEFCDEQGQCFGYTDPCGQECFKIVQQTRDGSRIPLLFNKTSVRPFGPRTSATSQERIHLLQDVDEHGPLVSRQLDSPISESAHDLLDGSSGAPNQALRKQPSNHSVKTQGTAESQSSRSSHSHDPHHYHNHHHHHDHHHDDHLDHDPHAPRTHHHHVPTNVFLSLSLQTSIAIALHKLPEGFITYATNHANPRLGFAIFVSLFIHNITEGFAMALPLYLAINSRWKAMLWSGLLGGLTQPLGAGLAALWFRVAGNRNGGTGPGEVVYGVMFAVTAGIMTMVSLQLFGESLDLTHSRKLCFVFAFVGMGILGLSSALTA